MNSLSIGELHTCLSVLMRCPAFYKTECFSHRWSTLLKTCLKLCRKFTGNILNVSNGHCNVFFKTAIATSSVAESRFKMSTAIMHSRLLSCNGREVAIGRVRDGLQYTYYVIDNVALLTMASSKRGQLQRGAKRFSMKVSFFRVLTG